GLEAVEVGAEDGGERVAGLRRLAGALWAVGPGGSPRPTGGGGAVVAGEGDADRLRGGGRRGGGAGRLVLRGDGAVLALGRRERLLIHRDQPLAGLAGRLGQQLLQPGAEVPDARRGEDGDLVAPVVVEHAHDGAEEDAGVVRGRDGGGAAVDHLLRAVEEVAH